jgi:hypothetical protein
MMSRDSHSALWFLAGFAVGIAGGIVFTPAAGGQMRRFLGAKAGTARGFVQNSGREYVDRGRELYEHGRMLADEAAEMFEEGRRLVEGVEH